MPSAGRTTGKRNRRRSRRSTALLRSIEPKGPAESAPRARRIFGLERLSTRRGTCTRRPIARLFFRARANGSTPTVSTETAHVSRRAQPLTKPGSHHGTRKQILDLSRRYRDLTAFNLSELVKIKSPSLGEKEVAEKLVEQMKAARFDEVTVDGLGQRHRPDWTRKEVIAFDGHLDTVAVGNAANWSFDPFCGDIRDGLSTAGAPPTRRAASPPW